MGRGRFLQLLSMPLSPCCPSCPAGMSHRFSQLATIHTAFAQRMGARLPVLGISRPPMGSLSLRPGDSLTIPRMALSVGFIRFVSSTNATQATGFLTFAPVGLSPTDHASLRWTHIRLFIRSAPSPPPAPPYKKPADPADQRTSPFLPTTYQTEPADQRRTRRTSGPRARMKKKKGVFFLSQVGYSLDAGSHYRLWFASVPMA